MGLSGWRAGRPPVVRILMLHGVGDARYPADVLEQQFRHVQKALNVVPLARIVDLLAEGASPDLQVALTFDDGLRNHLTVAYPILRRLGIPATFFVCPGLIESGRWLYNVEVRERIRTLEPTDMERLACRLGTGTGTVEGMVEGMVEWMKGLPTRKPHISLPLTLVSRAGPPGRPAALLYATVASDG